MPVHLPGHVVEHLHDLRDQRGLSVVGVSVNIPFGHAPYIEVEGVAVWVARRPDLVSSRSEKCHFCPFLQFFGLYSVSF